jgi:hypothetical protein
MEAHHEMNWRNTVVKRAIVVAISVLLALVVAAPIASGQSSSQSQNLGQLTADFWHWSAATSPSPVEGSYKGGAQCNGEYVKGVIFLAGSFDGSTTVERTCTVPANTPILFSPFNYLCGEAPTVQQPDGTFTGDPKPYTKCAKATIDAVIDSPSSIDAKVDGKDANQQRIASGLFQWTIPVDKPFLNFIPAGTYESAQDGLWVYLENGLNKGQHTVQFGGHFKDTPFGPTFVGTKVTYTLKAR